MALRGVNVGGWLVLEPWITPSLFKSTEARDEYSFCLEGNIDKLREHRTSFITEQDFVWLAEQGVEVVRIPVGYWLFGDVKPYASTVHYLDKAFEWAASQDIRVLIDLHAAPGSQNGNNHSGRMGKIGWHLDERNITATLAVLERIAKRYAGSPALLGISLLNEPSHTMPQYVVERFYIDAYKLLRQLCGPDIWVVFSDSFRPKQWRHRLSKTVYPGLYIDHHHYQLFKQRDKRWSARKQVLWAQFVLPYKLRNITRYHPVVIGEWSVALPSHAMSRLTPEQRTKIRQAYEQAQLKAFKKTSAWFFWTYKAEGSLPWNFRSAHMPVDARRRS